MQGNTWQKCLIQRINLNFLKRFLYLGAIVYLWCLSVSCFAISILFSFAGERTIKILKETASQVSVILLGWFCVNYLVNIRPSTFRLVSDFYNLWIFFNYSWMTIIFDKTLEVVVGPVQNVLLLLSISSVMISFSNRVYTKMKTYLAIK